jgi:hypothetical protein
MKKIILSILAVTSFGIANAQEIKTDAGTFTKPTTGTYIIELLDNDNTRSVSASYTVSASDTWEKKTITFPADTTGAFDNDNNLSLFVIFWLGAGTDRTSGTLQTSWGSRVTANAAVGQTNLAASTNNYWQITGVQLEVGSVVTDYEFKPFDVELNQCRRYYENSWYPGTTQVNSSVAITVSTSGYLTIEPKVSKRTDITTSNTTIYNGTTANQIRNMANNATVNISPDGTAINGNSTNIVSFYDLSPFAANTSYDFNWIMNMEL